MSAMADHTIVNLKDDVEDMAPKYGLSPGLESRFAREPLALEKSGFSYFRIGPGFKQPFGHRHREQEEVYVVVSGSARIRLEDEERELRQWDAVRVPGHVTRALQGGPDGAEVLAFGAPNTGNKDAEMVQGFWAD
jgi:mannose-6-phosphate isomerase-like protein (cupin superfamily)